MERLRVGSRLEMHPRATQLGECALHHANAMPAHTVGIEWAVPCRAYSLRETHCGLHFDA